MRWTAFAETLLPADYARLVNLLTAGRGYTYLAAQAASQNADTAAVLHYLDAALAHLRVVQRQLDPNTLSAPPLAEGAVAALAPRRWRAYLATRPPEDAAQVTAALRDALRYARRTAEVIHEDGEVEWARQRLAALLALLTLARRLCELLVMLYAAVAD